ncbi:hypothetical protein AHiyo8_27740 [Arthrobacter sp. Hiyo8]|nr:hypothetical protein AHiyo8_27740 [Arthrobacter sp. Hiyo8]
MSPAGSACTRAPPNVPRCRTWGSATVAAALASNGTCSAISGSVAIWWCVVMAPISRASPSSRTPDNSPIRPKSTTIAASARRSFITGIRL